MRWIRRRGMLACVGLLACGSPKAGDRCDGNPTCAGTTQLRCEAGIYQGVNCPGPQGCQEGGTVGNLLIVCDLTGTQAGAACTPGMEGFVLCASQASALVCLSSVFTATACSVTCVSSQPDGTGGACQ